MTEVSCRFSHPVNIRFACHQRLNIHEPVCARGPSKCYADLKPLRRYRKFYCVDRFLLAQFLAQIPTYLNLHHIFAFLRFDNIYIYIFLFSYNIIRREKFDTVRENYKYFRNIGRYEKFTLILSR